MLENDKMWCVEDILLKKLQKNQIFGENLKKFNFKYLPAVLC